MTTQSVFAEGALSGITVRTDAAYSVGTEFYVTSPMWLTGMRWYRPDTTSPGTVTGRVFTVDAADGTTGTPVCPVTTFTVSAGVGWKDAGLATPVRLAVGQRYRVATCAARFTQIDNYWTTGGPGADGYTRGALVAPNRANAAGLMQSSFGDPGAPGFPYAGFGPSAPCWFSDVIVDDVDPTGLSQRMFAGPLH